jgi:hypothetical protein
MTYSVGPAVPSEKYYLYDPYTHPAYSVGISLGDFNGDGKIDLAVTNSLGVGILLGNGDGTFQAPVFYGTGCESITVAGFNGDGRSDLVLGPLTGNGVSVLLGLQ